MQIQQLRYFLEIAKEKNISVAARNLYLSQPSLSQQIIRLEAELGIQLLVRHSKSVSLTDAGEQFAQHAMRIVGSVDQLADLMKKNSVLESGTLKIGLLWIANYIDLCPILRGFQKLHPNMDYSIKIDGSANLLQLLLQRTLHAAFLISSEDHLAVQDDLYYRKIQDDYYVAVISRQNPLSRKSVLRIEDLKGENLIMPSPSSSFRRQLDSLFEQHFLTPKIICETSQPDLVIRLAEQNFGISFSSESIASAMKTDAFAIVNLEQTLRRSIYYVTLKELLEYPSVKAFTRYVSRHRSIWNCD